MSDGRCQMEVARESHSLTSDIRHLLNSPGVLSYDQNGKHREVLSAGSPEILRPAPHLARYQRGRVRLHHGTLGRWQINAPAHYGHARFRLVRRVLLHRATDP